MTSDHRPNETEKQKKTPVALIVGGIGAVLVAIFIASNTQDTEVQFWFIDTTQPLWVTIGIAVLLGFVIGWSISAYRRRRSRKSPNK